MTDYVAYFLNGRPDAVRLDMLSISHPDMTQEYHVVRNYEGGLTVTLETGEQQRFEHYPLGLDEAEVYGALTYELSVRFGDLGEIFPKEIDAIRAADTMNIPPTVIYRAYSSDDLSAPMVGPLTLEMANPTVSPDGTAFTARPPQTSAFGTGEFYTFERFPALRGTL